jgi:putative ABC transport system substrate-binding protein
MRRREFIALVCSAAAASPLRSRAQNAKAARIGILWHAGSAEEEAIYLGALRQGLAEFGYVEGRNVYLEMRFPAEQYDRFFPLAAELVQLQPDLIVAAAGISAIAVSRATKTIPIVAVSMPDPIGSKLVASFNRPGGNLTGLSNMQTDLTAKRVELLQKGVANLSRAALLVNVNVPGLASQYTDEGQAAAKRLGLALEVVGVRGADELEAAFDKIVQSRLQGVVIPVDGIFYAERKRLADLALARHLPTMVFSRETLEAGALMSYGADMVAMYKRAAFFIDKILKGANPAEIPVEQPSQFQFIINLKAAKALNLSMPPAFLTLADELIE